MEKSIVLGCSKGKVMAINSETGEGIWKYNCPGGRYNIPVVVVDPPNPSYRIREQLVYIDSGQYAYCLKTNTGEVVWSSEVSNAKIG
jgi:outer membrane protein assembly factor BamB